MQLLGHPASQACSLPLSVSTKSAGAYSMLVMHAGSSCCQRYFLMMRLFTMRYPETSLYQPLEYSSYAFRRQLNQ